MIPLSTLGQNTLIRTQTGRLQAEIDKLQAQVSSGGEKSDNYGDLGSLSLTDINLRNQGERINTFKDNIKLLKIRTATVDQALSQIRTSALDVRDNAVQSMQFDVTRENLIAKARQQITDITAKLQSSADGRALFGGVTTDASPMVGDNNVFAQVQTAVNAVFAGPPPGNIPAAIEAAVSGVFATASNFYVGGAKYAPTEIEDGNKVDTSILGSDPAFVKVLTGLYTIASLPLPVDAPATWPQIDRPTFDQILQDSASTITSGVGGVEKMITDNGRNQKQIDDVDVRHDTVLDLLTKDIDGIEQVDLADVSTRITSLRTQLQASYEITAILKDLSLVNFLR